MYEFPHQVSHVNRQIRLCATRGMSVENLGFPEQMILMKLHFEKECNQERLVQCLDIDKGAVARTLTKLEEKGYVERRENPASKREKLVKPTPKANDAFIRLMNNLHASTEQAFKGFSAEEQRAFISGLDRIAANLDEVLKDEDKDPE